MGRPDEVEEVKVEARRLHKRAKRLGVEVPQEWYVTDEDDFESFIGGLYHDRLLIKIRNAQWLLLTSGIGLVGGIFGIAALVRSC